MAAHQEFPGKGVDGLGADAVEADAELENVIVVFGAGVDLGDAIHHFAQGDAAPEIAHADRGAFDADLHLLAIAHDEFVNGVIDDLLEQDVAAVIVMGAVADAPDVHAGAQADVFEGGKRFDFAFVVNVLFGIAHAKAINSVGSRECNWKVSRGGPAGVSHLHRLAAAKVGLIWSAAARGNTGATPLWCGVISTASEPSSAPVKSKAVSRFACHRTP